MITVSGSPNRLSPHSREALLTERARRGNTEAFSELVRALSPRLLWTARCVVHNPADAEDAVQNALWKAFRHLGDYREQAAFSTWLTRITVNEGIALLRKRKSDPIDLAGTHPLREGTALGGGAKDPTPEHVCAFKERQGALQKCLDRIHLRYKAVLCLGALEELNHQEIAQRLGLSVAAVKTRMHRARRILRPMLEHELVARRGAAKPGATAHPN